MKKKIWLIAALAVWALALLLIVLFVKPVDSSPAVTPTDNIQLTQPEDEDATLPTEEPTGTPTEEPSTETPTVPVTEAPTTAPTEAPQNQQAPPAVNPPAPPTPTNPPAPTEPEVVLIPPDLVYSQFGRYTGVYVEDGSDELVEDVAIVLITNPTNQFLEYAQIEFDVGDKRAVFVVRGLPAGASAWVMDANRLTVPAGSVYDLVNETTSFGSNSSTDAVKLTLGSGAISAENTSDKTLNNVFVYYRQVHTDGYFLGGICYRVAFGTLEPNAPMTATAGHCIPERAAVVKITCE